MKKIVLPALIVSLVVVVIGFVLVFLWTYTRIDPAGMTDSLPGVVSYNEEMVWIPRSAAGDDDDWNSVTYGNGLFVAVGSAINKDEDIVMTSPDGINWTARDAAGNDDIWTSVTYGNGLFVAVGSGRLLNGDGDRVMTSPDGINWTARSAAGNNDHWQGVTYGNGLFVAVGEGGNDRVMTSGKLEAGSGS